MKVILTERVTSLGNVGEIVNVSAGHARNYLFPQKLAVFADEKNQKVLDVHKRRLAKKIDAEKNQAIELKAKIDGMVVELFKKVGNDGKLFGTVTTTELSKELEKQEINVERRLISIPMPIKQVGTFNVVAKLFSGVDANFQVTVTIDPKQVEQMRKQQKMKKVKPAKAEEKTVEAQAETIEAEAPTEEKVEVTEEAKETKKKEKKEKKERKEKKK